MNFKNLTLLIIYILVLFLLCSCGFLFPVDGPIEINYTDESASNVATVNSIDVFHVETTSDYVNLKYKISNLNNNEVYFIFTNVSVDSNSSNPTVGVSYSPNYPPVNSLRNTGDNKEIRIIDNYKAKEFNQNPSKFLDFDKTQKTTDRSFSRAVVNDYVGDKKDFYTDATTSEGIVSAICCEVTSDTKKTLSIFVAENCWESTGSLDDKDYLVTQEMINTLSEKFLFPDAGNDIYDWVTGIYGAEWGAHDNEYYIGANDNITILLCDIKEDNIPQDSIIMGYFHSKDALIKTQETEFSNERIMFYIDAVMFANSQTADDKPGDGKWQITDYWPQTTISVLSHEFQHMIHFYQKFILNKLPRSSDIWIEEMCSLVTEDFVSNKIGVNGPRGVKYDDPTDGLSDNNLGRLPLYNEFDDDSLTTWPKETVDLLRGYSNSYSYGAYLARNYGGVGLFKLIVQSPFTDYRSINDALIKSGYSDDFGKTLQNWGAAVILSDLAVSEPYKYNNYNAWMSSVSDKGVSYELGSINLYNYSRAGQIGPYIYVSSPVGEERYLPSLNSSSNRFYLVSKNTSGALERTIKLDKNVKLTVVKK